MEHHGENTYRKQIFFFVLLVLAYAILFEYKNKIISDLGLLHAVDKYQKHM